MSTVNNGPYTSEQMSLAVNVWRRYAWTRDNGHLDFVQKYDKCDAFFRGDQWDPADLEMLREQRRPALTINKIISTVGNIMGEQIYNRSEISFRPRSDASGETATVLTKLFKQISDAELLDWKRSDMFADGIIGSRGYLDIRMDFKENLQGDISISNINPKNVLIDHDGEDYDPDTWNEIFVTKWMTADDIAVLYGEDKADALRGRSESVYPYGYDSIDSNRDRFGRPLNHMYGGGLDETTSRTIRVVERQWKKLTMQKFLSDPKTGETRPIPGTWTAKHTDNLAKTFGLKVIKKLTKRIRWTVIADNITLHDDWSPYKHFTVVPYFPYFRHGRTIGLVENLLGSQELLNKTSSQELHIINTTANSGWKIKTGALTNMTLEELEQKGAQSGIVLELTDVTAAEKITPNSTPTGLDRISYKAEEHIKTISGVDDTQLGQNRADEAAKAIQAKQANGAKNLAKPLDSLVRTDRLIARNMLDLIQQFYTEERVVTILKNAHTQETEQLTINQVTPEGTVINDLTIGEFDVIVSSVPVRETLEDSQFEQAMAMRDKGIQIPDGFIIRQSRLVDKTQLLQTMEAQSQSPEAQAQSEMQMRGMAAGVAKTEAEAASKGAEAQLKTAKAQNSMREAQEPAGMAEMVRTQADISREDAKFEHQREIDIAELQLNRKKMEEEARIRAQETAEQAITDRVARMMQTANRPRQPAAA